MAKLNRSSIVVLKDEEIKMMSDLEGLGYIKLDNKWIGKLRKELTK